MAECMYCNLCVYPCPEECIYMVGGPNAEKHEIDYEFSQYKRDGMIFEFVDATDETIRNAGGEKWLEQRESGQLWSFKVKHNRMKFRVMLSFNSCWIPKGFKLFVKRKSWRIIFNLCKKSACLK